MCLEQKGADLKKGHALLGEGFLELCKGLKMYTAETATNRECLVLLKQ